MFVTFDESAGQNTEGIAVDRRGTIYVSVSFLGDLWRLRPGSTVPRPFGHVDGIVPGRDFGMTGLALDAHGNVYAGVQSADPAANGVWRFDRRTGEASRLPGSEAIVIPNGLVFDGRGNLYITDSTGAIWWVPRRGSIATVWLRDLALTGDGSLGLFLGANGIAYRHGVFSVTNTERRTVLRIPKVGGGAGPISVLATLPAGDNPDGVALDGHGNAFVALNIANKIEKITPGGSFHVVASGGSLDFPSSLTFGPTREGRGERDGREEQERTTLYGVNFSIGEVVGLPPVHRPGIWKLST